MKRCLHLFKKYIWDEAWAWIGVFFILKVFYVWSNLFAKSPEGPFSLVQFTAISLIIFIAPGLFIITKAEYRSNSIVNSILLVFGLSISISTASVFFIYLLGIYYRTTLMFLLAFFSILGLWGLTAVHPIATLRNVRQGWQSEGWLERLTYIFFAIMFLDLGQRLVGQPFTNWDAIVSWDKWGCDMAERHALGAYSMGGYGQMVPTLYSIYYKTAGSFLSGIPDEQLLLHGLTAVFPILLFLSIIRICRVMNISWPVATVLFFGHYEICYNINSGYVDIPATAMNMMALSVLLDLLNKVWEIPNRPYLKWCCYSTFLFAAGFMKAHALIWIIFLIIYAVRFFHNKGSLRKNAACLIYCSILTAILLLPFYGHQTWLSMHFHTLAEHDPRLLSFRVILSRPDLFTVSAREAWNKLAVFMSRNQSFFPSGIINIVVTTPVLVLLIIASLRNRKTRSLLTASLLLILIWFFTRSYDYRNVLPAFALVTIIAAAGVSEAENSLPRFAQKAKPLIGLLTMLLFSGAFLWFYIANTPRILLTYSSDNSCWPVKAPSRLAAFNTKHALLSDAFNQSSIGKTAKYIHAFSPLYRYMGKRGIYLGQPYAARNINKGDLVVFQNTDPVLLSHITPICSLASMPFDAIGMKAPHWQNAHYSTASTTRASRQANESNTPIILHGHDHVDIRIAEFHNSNNLNSAIVQLQCDTNNTPITVHLHPSLRRCSSLYDNLRSFQTNNTVNYFFWCHTGYDPEELLLRAENTSSSSVTITNIMIVL